MREMAGSRGSHRSHHGRDSFAGPFSPTAEDKENGGVGLGIGLAERSHSGERNFSGSVSGDRSPYNRDSAMSPTMRGDSGVGASGRSSSAADRIGDWKRAQEVTSQLKLRIEVCLSLRVVEGLWK